MNIIYARMQGYQWISTPSDAVAREMEKQGHRIYIAESINNIPPGNYDFVWSPYETSLILGNAISQKFEIPLVSHLEVIPPWRIFPNIDVENHGLPKDDPEVQAEHLAGTSDYYQKIIEIWKDADIKTLSTPVRLPYHEKYFGPLENVQIRFPSIDTYMIERAKKLYTPKKQDNVILTVSRLMPVKRWDILVEVMNRLKTKVVWKIVGAGTYESTLKESLTNENVELQFLGHKWLWGKLYEMLSARLFVFSTGAMPPMEAALCGTPAVVMESQGSDHMPEFKDFQKTNFGDALPIFEYGKFDEMAVFIDEEMAKDKSTLLEEYDTVNKFNKGRCGITSSKINAQQILQRFKDWEQNV